MVHQMEDVVSIGTVVTIAALPAFTYIRQTVSMYGKPEGSLLT